MGAATSGCHQYFGGLWSELCKTLRGMRMSLGSTGTIFVLPRFLRPKWTASERPRRSAVDCSPAWIITQSPPITPWQSARCSFFLFSPFFFGRDVRRGIIYTTHCGRASSCQCARHLCGLSSLMNRAPGGPGLPGCSQTDADWWAPGCQPPADKRVTSTQKQTNKKKKRRLETTPPPVRLSPLP